MSHCRSIQKDSCEHSSFHVWLCVEYLTINRRGWWLEGRGSRVDGNCTLLCHRVQMRSWNWLFVCFGLEDLTSDLSFLYILRDCMVIALNLINPQWTIPSPPLSLVRLLDSKEQKNKTLHPQTDTLQMLQGCCEPLSSDGAHHRHEIGGRKVKEQVRHPFSRRTIPASCDIRTWL